MHFVALLALKITAVGSVFGGFWLGAVYYKNPESLGLPKEGINWSGKNSILAPVVVLDQKAEEDKLIVVVGKSMISADQPTENINYSNKNYACKLDEITDKDCIIEKIILEEKGWLYASSIKTDDSLSATMTDAEAPKDKELFKVKVSKELFEAIKLNESAQSISVELINSADNKKYATLTPYITIHGQDIKYIKTKHMIAKSAEYGPYHNKAVPIDQSNAPPPPKNDYKCNFQKTELIRPKGTMKECTISDASSDKQEYLDSLKFKPPASKSASLEVGKYYLIEYASEIDHLTDKQYREEIFYYKQKGIIPELLTSFAEAKPLVKLELSYPSDKTSANKNFLLIVG